VKEIISLGGGIQSSTMVLMNLLGEIEPKAECAIFSDTGWERWITYRYLVWLKALCAEHGFKIYEASGGNIKDDLLQSKGHRDMIPAFTATPNGTGMLKRQCTGAYKIRPIRRKMRERFGFQKFRLWIGFSLDEIVRAAPSRVKYITHRFPLLEKRMRRGDCIQWLKKHKFPIPERSACVCCPYRSDDEWKRMKRSSPEEFSQACKIDEQIRNNHLSRKRHNYPLYLHKSLQPLRTVEFSNPNQLDFLEEEECAGGCWL